MDGPNLGGNTMKIVFLLAVLISAPVFANHNSNEPPEGYYGLDQPRDQYESRADYERIQQERQRQDDDRREDRARQDDGSSYRDYGGRTNY